MFGACHVMLFKSIRLQTLMFPKIFKSGTEEEKYAPCMFDTEVRETAERSPGKTIVEKQHRT